MKKYKTIKGFLTKGELEPSNLIFKNDVALRIGGMGLNFSDIETKFNVKALRTHKKGDTNGSIIFKDDMWLYSSTQAIPQEEDLETHIKHINEIFLPQLDFLKKLKKIGSVVIYSDYLTNSDTSSMTIHPKNLVLFYELNISFSINFGYI